MDILELKAQLKAEEDPKKRADLLAQLEVFKQNAKNRFVQSKKMLISRPKNLQLNFWLTSITVA